MVFSVVGRPSRVASGDSKAKNNMVNLYPSGLVINPKCPWLGCTPDRRVFDMQEVGNHNMSPYGLLEIKVVCKQGVQSLKDVDYLKQNPNTKEFF